MMISLAEAMLSPAPTREEFLRQREAFIQAARSAIILLEAGPRSIADSPQIREERVVALLRGAIRTCAQ